MKYIPLPPKEKALSLVNDMYGATDDWENAKICALIATEEAEKSEYNVLIKFNIVNEDYISNYLQEVKKEIEAL